MNKVGAGLSNFSEIPTWFNDSWQNEGECWIWQKGTNNYGYGYFYLPKKVNPVLAHRWIYELVVGPIPEKYVVDHICCQRKCVLPTHLRAIQRWTNTILGQIKGLPKDQLVIVKEELERLLEGMA